MKSLKATLLTTGLCLVLLLGSLSLVACSGTETPTTVTATTTATATETTTATATTTATTTATATKTEVIKPIELNYCTMVTGPTVQYEEVWGYWVNEVEERSGGKVKINVFFSGQICPVPETYDSVVSGMLDIANHYPGLTPGRFTCLESIQIPMLDTLPGRISIIPWELYNTFPEFQAQFSDTHPLAFYCTSIPYQGILATVDKPIRQLEDMQGLKISASGTWPGKTIQALGAAPMQMNSADIYMNLEKKVIDGARIDPEMLDNAKLEEIVRYVTLVNTGYVPFWFVMNQDTWSGLPDDVKQVFDDLGGEWIGETWDSYTEWHGRAAREHAVEAYGLEQIELSDEEMARWVAIAKPIQQEYIDAMEADGLPGQAMVDMIFELMEKYKFTGYDD